MSMYSELLSAALAHTRRGDDAGDTRAAIDEARQRRDELELDVPPATEPDAVHVLLARQVGYDVALVRLARLFGIDTGPGQFDRPESERSRLEAALGEHGIRLDGPAAPPGRTVR